MSSIFISHSSRDNATAALIRDWLTGQGYSSQFLDFDPQNGIPAGRSWERELYRQLKAAQAVIALCSENFNASEWCFAEITQARALGKPVFAVKIDACALKSIFRQEQTVDFATNQGEAYERLGRGLQLAGLDPRDSFPWNEGRSPFPGLQAFEEADAAVFFGRNEAIQQTLELLARMRRYQTCRFALLLGASGSGKSSLMRAGVLPRLRKGPQEWLTIPAFRPREDPVNEFAVSIDKALNGNDWKSVREQLRRAAASGDTAPLVDLAYDLRTHSNSPDASVLITVDQFEELLGRPADHPAHLLGEILRLAISSENSPFVVVGVLRSDFLAQFQSLEPWSRLVYENLPIASLGPENMVEIIEKPAQLASIDLEPGFVQAMLADAGRDALPLLAFALRQLWDKFGSLGRFTVQNYLEDIGGMRGLLSRSADEALGEEVRSDDVTQSLRRAFSNLVRVTESGQFARQAARWEAMPDLARAPLERLIQARLLVTWTEKNVRMVEVAHEALFRAWDPLAKWLDADQEFLLWQRRLGSARSEWERTHRDEGALLRGGLLAEAEAWVAERRESFDALDGEFISASVALREKERTEQEIREWDARLEAARAFYERSFVLAEQSRFQSAAGCLLRSLEIAPRSGAPAEYPSRWGRPAWAEEAWTYFRYLDQQRAHMVARLTGQRGNITSVSLGHGLRLAATGCFDGTMQLWGLQSRQLLGTFGESNVAVTCVALGEKKLRILRGSLSGQVLLLDPEAGDLKVLHDGSGDPVTSVGFSSNEKWVLAGFRLGAIGVWDAETGTPVTGYQDHSGSVTFLACDEARQVIASGSGRPALGGWLGDGGVQLWDMRTRRRVGAIWARLGDSVGSVAVSADFQTALKGLESGVIQLWRMGTDAELKSELISTLTGHNGSVTSLAFSPDGRKALSGSTDSTARVWDLETGTGLAVLEGHNEAVLTVAFGPSAEWALTGSFDGSIGMWDLGHNQSPRHFADHKGWVSAVTVSSDGRRILSGGSDKTAQLWDLETGQSLATLVLPEGHASEIQAVAFVGDGANAVSASKDGLVCLWDTNTGRQIAQLPGPASAVASIAICGRMVLAGYGDRFKRITDPLAFGPVQGRTTFDEAGTGSVVVWDAASRNGARLDRHTAAVSSVAFDSTGTLALSGSFDNTARLCDAQSGRQIRAFRGHDDGVWSVAFMEGGSYAVTASLDNSIRVWDLRTGNLVRSLEGHTGGVGTVAAIDRTRIVSGSADKSIRVWDVPSGVVQRVFEGHAEGVTSVAVSADGKRIASGSLDTTVRIWDLETGEVVRVLEHPDVVWCVAFGADGTSLVTGCQDAIARVWQVACGRLDRAVQGQTGGINAVFAAADGRIVTGSEGGSIQLWESQAREPLTIVENRGVAVLSLALSLDGKRVLSGWQDGLARISNLEGSGEPAVLCEPMGDVLSAAACAQAPRIVLASADRLVWVWDTNGERLKKLAGHTATVTTVALSPDGRIAGSGSLDGSVRIWDLEAGTTLRVLTGHTKGVLSVAICPDGKAALSGSADQTVRLWDLETGKQLRVFSGIVAESVAVSPDGRTAVIARGSQIELLPLLGMDVSLEPPVVHAADGQDIYREFAALYQSVGLRVIREGPGMGELELA